MTFQDATNKLASALQGAPMLVALLALNAGVLGMITWLTVKSAEHRAAERAELVRLLDQCMRTTKG